MIKVWLKPNWKEILKGRYAIVEISGGTVSDYEVSEDVKLTVIDHDNLEEEIPTILESLGIDEPWEVADYIYDDVVAYMKETGDENILDAVKNGVAIWLLSTQPDGE